jgi:hypothetical protein
MERAESESFGLLCPELANTLKGSQASETLEALREVVGVEGVARCVRRLLCVS